MRSFLALMLAASALPSIAVAAPLQTVASPSPALWNSFLAPPDDARPMVRWWWFGPAVTDTEIDREIRAMKAGGFGGFEVQPTYPLSPDDAPAGLVNIPYLSDPFIAALRHAGDTARAEDMRIDVTIGSGWPFGGPHIPISQAAANVRIARVPIPAGSTRAALPATGPGETLLATFLERGAGMTPARIELKDGALPSPSASPRTLLAFVAGRTGQQVKRPAIEAEGYVIDHIDPAAVANHLTTVGDRLLAAFPKATPPYAMFSDSLEAYGSSWTGDLPQQFRSRRGYDLLEHLPALFADAPESAAVRHDWALTLSELVDERYLATIDAWAKARGTRFRAQVYGFPPPTLSSNALVALPEGEGADWRSFTSTRWATSAAHLYGRPVVSSETWTWLHSPAFAATPLDMKIEADRHFLQGITQLIGHGWPYSPPGVSEPGWAFYAAAVFNDHNPWYPVMPDVNRYLQRVSAMLRQGEPANAVALYIPTEDTFADLRPERASVNEEMGRRLSRNLIAQILDAGHGFDLIDGKAITSQGIRHRILILPALTRIDPEAYRAIAAWVAKGGKVIAIGAPPSAAGGLRDGPTKTREVTTLSRNLFRPANAGAAIVEEAALGQAISRFIPPDMALVKPDPTIGFIRRKLPTGDVYFIVNTGNVPVDTSARFTGDKGDGQWWDAVTGARHAAGTGAIPIRLAPYESRLLIFGVGPSSAAPTPPTQIADLSAGWTQTFPGRPPRNDAALKSWTEDPTTRTFSGAVRYTRTLNITPDMLAAGPIAIDFGQGKPLTLAPRTRLRAAIEAPVREAAIVSVNGTRAGSVWAFPYRLDLTKSLRPGRNQIEITVMNGALNAWSDRPPADYRLLTARYGERFQAQDVDKVAPQPSGLLGPVSLMGSAGTR